MDGGKERMKEGKDYFSPHPFPLHLAELRVQQRPRRLRPRTVVRAFVVASSLARRMARRNEAGEGGRLVLVVVRGCAFSDADEAGSDCCCCCC